MDFTADLFPTTSLLTAWYESGHRVLPWRDDPTAYHVWISEIMLQQTRVQAVIPYYQRFLSLYPDVHALAQAPEDPLLKAWEGLGYYSRARNIQKAAQLVCQRWDGQLPHTYADWLSLPGIGPYTAGAVCSIALGLPVPAVDGNVLRVFSRLLSLEEDISQPKVKEKITRLVSDLIPVQKPGIYNQALMELGATVCLPAGIPLCEQCPVREYCSAYANETPTLFPLKSPKKDRKIQLRTVFLLEHQGRLGILQRPPQGLLSGMWELPNSEGHLTDREARSLLEQWIVFAGEPIPLSPAKHIFTHLEWQMIGWRIPVESYKLASPYRWATTDELQNLYAIPSAFSAFLAQFFR